jgi:urease accessory protein
MSPDAAPSFAVLRLLQICSPAFPIGAFAYSQGLEQAAEVGWISEPRELGAWLNGMLRHSIARTDLPLLRTAYQLWQRQPAVSTEEMVRLGQHVLAYRETAELRAEEQHLGRSLGRLLSHLGVEEAAPFATHDDATYLVMFALAAARFGISETDMLGGFAFAWAENQVSAASRVMRLGQLAAQSVLSDFVAHVPAAVRTALSVAPDEIGYSSPAFFLASAWHEEQYSRLFRS